MQAYQAALAGVALPLPSSLPGGIIAKRGVDPGTVQPLIGIYLLMLKGKVVYIGSSLNMPSRVAGHRSNGRPFDQVSYIATRANQREQLEATLIRAIHAGGTSDSSASASAVVDGSSCDKGGAKNSATPASAHAPTAFTSLATAGR